MSSLSRALNFSSLYLLSCSNTILPKSSLSAFSKTVEGGRGQVELGCGPILKEATFSPCDKLLLLLLLMLLLRNDKTPFLTTLHTRTHFFAILDLSLCFCRGPRPDDVAVLAPL